MEYNRDLNQSDLLNTFTMHLQLLPWNRSEESIVIIPILDIYPFVKRFCLLTLVSWIYQREAQFFGKVQQNDFFLNIWILLMGRIGWQTGTQNNNILICIRRMCNLGRSPLKVPFIPWQRLTMVIVSRMVEERTVKVGWISPKSEKEIKTLRTPLVHKSI